MSNDTQVQTLTDFLLARIAEDVEAAQAASHRGGHWTDATRDNWGGGAVEAVDGPARDTGIVVYDEGYPTEAQSVHIAIHDPARVLAECEAKRRIVDLADLIDEPSAIFAAVDVLASVYADHPDYREEWKP